MTESNHGPAPSLPGPEPTGPEVLLIRALHRHDDGVITFHRKDAAGNFENLFAIRSEYLQGMFPEIREQLEADSFFSINAFWHRDRRQRQFLAAEVRQKDKLRYLCSVYVDLDAYKADIDFGTALGMVITYQEEGKIPPPSVIERSGRGLWLYWVLSDPTNPSLPQKAFPEKVRLYVEINRAAGDRLAQLGADAAARDALRLARVPGSVHTGATGKHKRVKYWLKCGADGQPQTYTLTELADAFGVQPRLDAATRRAYTEASRPPGSHLRGHAQLNARRLREFDLLRSMRGGFLEGTRNYAALLYAWLLGRNGMARDAVLRQVEELARECHPPLDLSSCRSAVKTASSRKIRRLSDQTISDWLDITHAESDYLEKLSAATRFRVRLRLPPTTRPIKHR